MHRFLYRRLLLATALCAAPFAAFAHSDGHSLSENALVQPAEVVDCTLENGDAAKCNAYTVKFIPDGLDIGPFCPATLDDVGGVWDWDGEKAGLYRIDRAYLEMLAGLGYQFYDDDGAVNVFDIRVEGPEADHECIAGTLETAADMSIRALIPITPVMAASPTPLGTVAKVGMALDGVPIFADAPSVLDTGHMPALDTCGGHVDPGGWYHWHATSTDINTVFSAEDVDATCAHVLQDETAQFGYAFDGFAMFGSVEGDSAAPVGLDACGGHVGPLPDGSGEAYHYHSSDSFPNLPTCLVGVVAQDNFSTTAAQGIGSTSGLGGPGGPGGGRPDFSAAAAALGIDVTALQMAIEAEGGREADLAHVAARLGISLDALQAAMPPRP
ncbi:YHYH protein [Pseudorhodobacter sp. E13]|uniref:YHYH protein n=1 Tax=Pseudorhodobacter sp. E13 TaxID=2487931 RepID=UPI000F8DC4F6|nr:YHYH protein [Pseudorhodobacter sp. E13]RUS59232.1 YHYH protein [Pseudorhodobacter sp. E13]